MKLATAIAMALLLAAAAHPALADTHIVDAGGGGDFLTIQAALDAALDGDTIEVVAGAYTGDGNRDLSFGTKNLTLISQSGAASTVIDNEGDGGHRLFNFYGGGQDTTCVVSGFTIQGGRFVQAGSPGAGIRIDGTGPGGYPNPKFTDCHIRNNHSYGGNGGGAYVNMYCQPIFDYCTFDSNTALSSGGGLYASFYSTPKVRNCTFLSNQCSTGFGAGMACNYVAHATVRHCWFEGNVSGDQGGAFGVFDSMPFIFYSVFLNNLATTHGGAVYGDESEAQFRDCTFVKNRSLGEGSVFSSTETSTEFFSDCIFAFSQPSSGRSSTFYCDGESIPDISSCCSHSNPDGDVPCGNVSTNMLYADPLFCDITTDDLTLASNSPCLPATNPWGGQLGALEEGCVESPVEETSWGTIKAMYR